MPSAPRRILVVMPNWVGDVVMSTPALRALREHFSNAHIVALAKPYLAPLVKGSGLVDAIWTVDYASNPLAPANLAWLVRMRHTRFDLALLFPAGKRSAVLTWVGGARRRIGYLRRPGRERWLTDVLTPPRDESGFIPYSTMDYYLDLTSALGCERRPQSRLELSVDQRDARLSAEVWGRLGLRDGRVAVFNCSGAYGGAKLWPTEYFAELARLVASDLDRDVLILCGPAERRRALEIERLAAQPRVKSLAHFPLSIGLSMACVKRSCFMVSTDSGPRHFAAAFDVPVVTLFGPTHTAWSDTRHPGEVRLQLVLECGPCQQRECPLGHHRCMRDLGVDRVFEAVQRLMERTS